MAASMTPTSPTDLRNFLMCRRARLLLTALVCTLTVGAVTGCGGGQKARRTTETPTTTTASATTTPAVSVAADKAKARTLLLRSSDFPVGWKATPAQNENGTLDEQLAACLARRSPDTYTTADIVGPDFSLANAQAGSHAELVRTVEDFKADVAAASGPKFMPCVRSTLTKSLRRQLGAQGASLQSLTVESLRVPRYGEFSMGLRTAAKVMVTGQRASFYIDVVLLGKERIELTAVFGNVDQPFDPALELALLAKLDGRLGAA